MTDTNASHDQVAGLEVEDQEARQEERPEVRRDEADSYMAELRRIRRESARYRVSRNQYRDQAEGLTAEVEKLRGAVAAAQAAEQQARGEFDEFKHALAVEAKKSMVFEEAERLNSRDPDAVWRLLDIEALEVDREAIAEAVSDLLESKPYLQRPPDEEPPPTPGVGGRPIQGKPSTDEMWAEMLRRGASRG